jgi:Glycosyl transferases group 1/Glycosyltransferase Family 4
VIRTLHVDTGRTMQGGQWQVLYLVERLKDATLLAPDDSPLFTEAHKREIAVRPATGKWLETNPALVHAHDSRAHTLATLNLKLYRLPLVVSRRVGFAPKQSLFSQLKYRFVDRYLAVSKYVAMQLREAGVPAAKIRVVYDGIPIPASTTKPKPGRVLAVPTKFTEIPGIPVRITKNLFDDLQTASVFLYVSEMEGLGSAAIAAMAAGVPVVASGVGGLPEVVDHERTGLIVRDGDYAKAVRRLLDNPNLAAELGAAGREKAIREFSVEKMVESTLSAYNEILR